MEVKVSHSKSWYLYLLPSQIYALFSVIELVSVLVPALVSVLVLVVVRVLVLVVVRVLVPVLVLGRVPHDFHVVYLFFAFHSVIDIYNGDNPASLAWAFSRFSACLRSIAPALTRSVLTIFPRAAIHQSAPLRSFGIPEEKTAQLQALIENTMRFAYVRQASFSNLVLEHCLQGHQCKRVGCFYNQSPFEYVFF
jgi:hypothetical protein